MKIFRRSEDFSEVAFFDSLKTVKIQLCTVKLLVFSFVRFYLLLNP